MMGTNHISGVSFGKGLVIGMVGSVIAMLAMDLVMVVEFAITGMPASTYLSLIGSIFGGGVKAGVVIHLLMGAGLGLVFGLLVMKIDILRIHTVTKGVGLGIAAGLLTIPFGCIPFAIMVNQPILRMLSFSCIPHLVWGACLGIIAGYGMRSLKKIM